MSEEKQAKIKKILEMQKKFMALDREQGVEASEYFAPDDESEIAGFRAVSYTHLTLPTKA